MITIACNIVIVVVTVVLLVFVLFMDGVIPNAFEARADVVGNIKKRNAILFLRLVDRYIHQCPSSVSSQRNTMLYLNLKKTDRCPMS